MSIMSRKLLVPLTMAAAGAAGVGASAQQPDFVPLFNGKDLPQRSVLLSPARTGQGESR
jgi:hypothetical protein